MRNHAFAAFLGSILFIGLSAGAAPQSTAVLPTNSASLNSPISEEQPIIYQGRASLSQTSFVSPDYKITDKKDFQFIGIGVDSLSKTRQESDIQNGVHTQIDANIAPGASVLNYLNVSQLFWKHDNLILGRKKLEWSEIDESYSLGLFQPNFSWNVLQPESQGLTGLFLNVETKNESLPGGIYLFASNVFIPDQGAGYEIKDGKFQKSSPYFPAPPTQVEVNGQTDSVVYNIQKPATEDVIFNRSFAAKAYLGEEESGGFIQAAYANKPSNQLSMGFKGALTPNNSIAVDILPATYFHRLLSGDAQYSFGPAFTVGVSAMTETIEDPTYEAEWTYRSFAPSQMVSPYIKTRIKNFKAKLSYLKITGAEFKDLGPNANLSEYVLKPRYAYTEAYLAEISYRHRIRRYQGFVFSTKYLTGAKSEFALWNAEATYQWEERWSAYADMQLASVENTKDGKAVSYFDHMNNDTASLGVRHVF